MKIYVDADGCPVVNETISLCKKYNKTCVLICDTAHYFNRDGAETIVVSKGADSVDMVLVNKLTAGDVAITQDYGLAAMCLAKGATIINQDGLVYDGGNILPLLNQRHTARKIRMAGGRQKGVPKRTKQQTDKFIETMERIIKK